jgi:cytochrome c oxidase subunit III
MATTGSQERKRLHPHKFTMWVALASIVMMFAGLTSAYIVKRNQVNFQVIELPQLFWYSTLVILISSVTIHLALKSFKVREMGRYRSLILVTGVLGVTFIVLQWMAFMQIQNSGIPIFGNESNAAASFLGIIAGLHGLHVVGGVIAVIVMFLSAFFSSKKVYSSTGIEILSTYWHFVGGLWIYLFIFLNWL